MFNNSFKIIFMLILMMGTLITVSSNSWLSAWMGLEINLLAFIPLMSDNNLMSTESSLKYFLTQALASTVFLFATMFFLLENYYLYNINIYYSKMLILSSLLMKMGAAPFHFWFPNVMQGLSWMNALILMTWQKIAPFLLISYVLHTPMIILCSILSAMFGAIGGLNQTSLFKLMAYSSINHLSWMLMSMVINEFIWFTYFMFYSFLSFNLILMFNMFNISHINQLFMFSTKSKVLKFINFMNLLSLGGLPPFIGFMPKWLVIQYLTISNQLITTTIMITMALLTLFFYLRLCYTSFMLNHNKANWLMNIQFNKMKMNIYMLSSTMSIMGLFMISLFYMML